jgi:LmbE family N-acetylglucosaminyl deacetylase
VKALCLVAHPDDCVLFGYQFIVDHSDWDWHVWYLTYTDDSDRVQELRKFWKLRGVSVSAGGFIDDWDHVSSGELGFDAAQASACVLSASRDFDLLLSHNAVGEYGHPHHLFIHDAVKDLEIPKVYFGTWPDQANHLIVLETAPYSSGELPLHKNVIDDFDLTNWKYLITPESENLVNYTRMSESCE